MSPGVRSHGDLIALERLPLLWCRSHERIVSKSMNPLVPVVAMLVLSAAAHSQVIYDIDFNRLPQVPGIPVVSGTAPHHVSEILWGTPTVESSVGGLTDQPLKLDHSGNNGPFYYDQIQIVMPEIQPSSWDLFFDFTSLGLVGSDSELAVLFDTPAVRNVYFRGDGHIYLYGPTSPYYEETEIGTFSDGEVFRIHVHVDLEGNEWSAYKNGVLLGSTPFFMSGSSLNSIRFSYGLPFGALNDTSTVGIDNIIIAIPEPGTSGMLLCGGVLLQLSTRRIRNRLFLLQEKRSEAHRERDAQRLCSLPAFKLAKTAEIGILP